MYIRTLDEGNFAGVISEDHARDRYTRARPAPDAFMSSLRFISALGTVVPNCSDRFHLTHVALECRAGAH